MTQSYIGKYDDRAAYSARVKAAMDALAERAYKLEDAVTSGTLTGQDAKEAEILVGLVALESEKYDARTGNYKGAPVPPPLWKDEYIYWMKDIQSLNKAITDFYKKLAARAGVNEISSNLIRPPVSTIPSLIGLKPSGKNSTGAVLGGLGSIGGAGHGFGGVGGGSGGPNSTDFHGIPGMGGFGKRPGDDEGGLGTPGVHGSGFQGDFGNGFFGVGFLHGGVGKGLPGGGSTATGGGGTGKARSGGTGGSYVDANTKNDARGSEKGGGGGTEGTTSGGGSGSTDKDGEVGAVDSYPEDKDGEAGAVDSYPTGFTATEGTMTATQTGVTGTAPGGYKEKGGGGNKPSNDGGGGDTGGGATDSRPTFTGYQPRNHGSAVDAVTVGVGQHHLPGSPVSYITATSHVGSIGGTTEGFGGTNPNVRVYRPDPEASGGGSGPRNPFFMPSEEAGSPRGPSARIARQVTVASTGVRTRLR